MLVREGSFWLICHLLVHFSCLLIIQVLLCSVGLNVSEAFCISGDFMPHDLAILPSIN